MAGPLRTACPTPEVVLEVVARQFGLRVRDLRAPDRSKPRTQARHLGAYLLRTRCGLSYPEIGRRLDRDHSTALYGVRRTEERLTRDASLASLLGIVEKELVSRAERGR